MDSELEKLVESGKLTSKSAEQLDKLRPGTFCLHKSWGFGRVAEWNLLVNQIVIDFTAKKSHPMQLQYAAENLTRLAPEHFLARKATDLMSIKQLAKDDPAALVRNILESHGGKATVQEISEWLIGDVFSEAEWKRWWESTKKRLKSSGYFSVPAKKNEPVQLRAEAVSNADELIASFNRATKPKEKAEVLDQIIKLHTEFKEPEKQLQPIVTAMETAAMRNQKMHPEVCFDLIVSRDELLERIPRLRSTIVGFTLTKLIVDEESRLAVILSKLSATR
jgi:transcription elongation factor GreA-like protein